MKSSLSKLWCTLLNLKSNKFLQIREHYHDQHILCTSEVIKLKRFRIQYMLREMQLTITTLL